MKGFKEFIAHNSRIIIKVVFRGTYMAFNAFIIKKKDKKGNKGEKRNIILIKNF